MQDFERMGCGPGVVEANSHEGGSGKSEMVHSKAYSGKGSASKKY